MKQLLTRDNRFLLIIIFSCMIMIYSGKAQFTSDKDDRFALRQELHYSDSGLVLLPANSRFAAEFSASELTRHGIAPFFYSPISVNSADREMLMMLPGIGPAMAERILRFREKNGPIRSPEKFMQIKGIGPKTIERLKDRITFT